MTIYSILEKVAAGEELTAPDGYRLLECREGETGELLRMAGDVRDRAKGRTVTYSRKIFLPITNLCRDRCSYCTFRKDPNDPDAWTMTPDDIDDVLRRGKENGCKEALMCLGDRPEEAFPQYRRTLAGFGYRTTVDYVYRACEMSLRCGILPHTRHR